MKNIIYILMRSNFSKHFIPLFVDNFIYVDRNILDKIKFTYLLFNVYNTIDYTLGWYVLGGRLPLIITYGYCPISY